MAASVVQPICKLHGEVMITDYHSILKMVRTLSSNAGLGLELTDDTNVIPHTDGKKIVVHKPTMNTDLDRWMYSVFHEIRHNTTGKDLWPIIEETKGNKFLSTLWNIFEDYRIERIDNNKYAGEKKALDLGRKKHLDKQLDVKGVDLKSVTDERTLLIHGIAIWETSLRGGWNREIIGYDNKLADRMSDTASSIAKSLEKYSDELSQASTARDTLNLARKIYQDELSEDSRQEHDQGNSRVAGEVEESSESTKGWEKSKEMVLSHDHDAPAKHGAAYRFRGMGDFTPRTREQISEVVFPYRSLSINKSFQEELGSMLSSRVSKELRKLLQTRNLTMYNHGQKKGKLSSKNVYRATMSDSGSYQEKIFKQKIDKIDLDVAVTILGDCSASMAGNKFLNMSAACINISEALKPLKVPHEILGFGCSKHLMNYVFKSFKTNPTRDNLVEYFSQAAEYLSCNSDGESLLLAWDRLRKHTAKRKVIIILSDGQPSPSTYSGDCHEFTCRVAKELESIPGLDLYSIGIEDNEVKYIYKNWTILNSSDNIEKCIINLIKTKIVKGI